MLQLSWQLSWRVATEPSDSSWAELSRQFATELTELTDCCQVDRSWLSRQIAAETTDCRGGCTLQLSWCFAAGLSQQINCTTEYVRVDRLQLSLQMTAELTDCRWTYIVQGRAAKEATDCSQAIWLQTGWKLQRGWMVCTWADSFELTGTVAAELTNSSWADYLQPKPTDCKVDSLMYFVSHVLRPCWKTNYPQSYEDLYRRQRPHLTEQEDAVVACIIALDLCWYSNVLHIDGSCHIEQHGGICCAATAGVVFESMKIQ